MAFSNRSAARISIFSTISKLFALSTAMAAAVWMFAGCAAQTQLPIILQPPTLDSSTPQTQGLFTLVGIQARTFPVTTLGNPYSQESDGKLLIHVHDTTYPLHYKCLVTASNGDSYFLYPQQPPRPPRPGQAVIIDMSTPKPPPGLVTYYMNFIGPKAWRYLDIDFSDFSGNHARWRLNNIPHFHSLGLIPKTADEHVTVDGLTIDTAAIRSHVSGNAGIWFTQTRFTPPISSNISYAVTIKHRKTDPDRYTSTPITSYGKSPYPDEKYELWNEEVPMVAYGELSPDVDSYYARQVIGTVTKVQMLDEPVTFHDVKVLYTPTYAGGRQPCLYVDKPQSITTPSGITVSFLMLNPDEVENAKTLESFGTRMPLLPYAESIGGFPATRYPLMPYLPLSPLCMQYHKHVRIEYFMVPPTNHGEPGPIAPLSYYRFQQSMIKSDPHATVLKDLRVVVRQIVTVQDTPFSVTVPFHDDNSPRYIALAKKMEKRDGYGAYAPNYRDPWYVDSNYCFENSNKVKNISSGK
jgi:hypothetical protein